MHNALHFINMLSIWQFMLTTWILAVVLVLFGTYRSLVKLSERKNEERLLSDRQLPPLSILKPLRGVDKGLEANLESFFRADYPEFELLLSVADSDDPAVAVVRNLMRRYPNVHARLFIGESEIGLNPKINNIFKPYHEARHEVILISDSNTRIAPDYLRRMASQLRPDVAMQSSVVLGADPSGLGGALEATFLNTYYARSVMMVETLGHPCIMGKAMMFRKSIFEREVGWQAISSYIAEDYEAGHRLLVAGHKIRTTTVPIEQYIGEYSVRDFWSRHVRWGRIRKLQAPLPFCIEYLVGAIASGVIGAAVFSHFFHFPALLFFALHLLGWFACDSLVLARLGQDVNASTALVWLLRELIHLPLWIHIGMGNSILWRGRKIRLARGGVVKAEDAMEGSLEECSRS